MGARCAALLAIRDGGASGVRRHDRDPSASAARNSQGGLRRNTALMLVDSVRTGSAAA